MHRASGVRKLQAARRFARTIAPCPTLHRHLLWWTGQALPACRLRQVCSLHFVRCCWIYPPLSSAWLQQMAAAAQLPQCEAIVFSKDRPWQLGQLLASMDEYAVDGPIQTHVIYAASTEAFEAGYAAEFKRAGPHVKAKPEAATPGGAFADILQSTVADIASRVPLLAFFVDDVCFHAAFAWSAACAALSNPAVACFHFKLHPSVEYAHPPDAVCSVPKLTLRHRQSVPASFCTGPLQTAQVGSGDWRYPFELCATALRASAVERILVSLAGESGDTNPLSHPNLLEAAGARLCRGEGISALLPQDTPPDRTPLLACPVAPCCTCITVNRVQDHFSNSIFESEAEGAPCTSAEGLLQLAGGSSRLNAASYAGHHFSSVHIGLFELESKESAPEGSTAPPCAVDIVMPAHNAVDTVVAALGSIAAQSSGAQLDLDTHTVVVDDGSSDSTWEVLCKAAGDLWGPLHHDSASQIASNARCTLVHLDQQCGVAAALNRGLAVCRPHAEYIARMDADDVCVPHRLSSTILHMRGNGLQACGAAAALFDASSSDVVAPCPEPGDFVVSRQPCHPVLLAWRMLWQCSLVHPTLVATREWWGDTPYRAADGHAEDYALWLRKLSFSADPPEAPAAVGNIGTPLLWHRKHARSVSAEHASEQRTAAAAHTLAAWRALLPPDCAEACTEEVLCIAREGLQPGQNVQAALHAARCMLALRDAFLAWSGCNDATGLAQHCCHQPAFASVSCAALVAHVHSDIRARVSALAMQGLGTLGPAALPLLKLVKEA